MQSYFFIPGNRLHKVEAIQSLGVTIVIDLEDAVKFSERNDIIKKLCADAEQYSNFYIRVPLYAKEGLIDLRYIKKLTSVGFKKFILPKIESAKDFKNIIASLTTKELQIILLVETTGFFLELQQVLREGNSLIKAVALGSHDFMSEVGGLHTLKNLEYPRTHLLYLARMADIEAIDIASMELQNEKTLTHEIIDGFEKGYDAKFYIHPWQISVSKKINLYIKEDFIWAKKVHKILKKVNNSDEFNPIVMDGKIIERPHLKKAKKILQYYESK